MAVLLIMGIMGAGCHFLFFKQKGFDIKVKNQAVENISGLYLSYQHIPLYRPAKSLS